MAMFARIQAGWPVTFPEVRWGLREAFLCLIAAQVLAALWVTVLLAGSDGIGLGSRSIAFLVVGNVALWIGYFVGPVQVSRRLGRGWRRDFDIGVSAIEGLVAVGLGIGLQLALLPALYWPIERLVDADPGASARELVSRIDGSVDVLLLTVAVVLVGPVAEEWFYRGMLLPALASSVGPTLGIIGSAFIFGLVHQNLVVLPGLMAFGAVVGWLTASTGRIGPAIVTHMSFNATTVVQLLLER